jgi:hypothetical protein
MRLEQLEFDRETGGRGDEVSKVRVEGIVSVSKVHLGVQGGDWGHSCG